MIGVANHAEVLSLLGDDEQAVGLQQEAVRLCDELFGSDSEHTQQEIEALDALELRAQARAGLVVSVTDGGAQSPTQGTLKKQYERVSPYRTELDD